MMKKANSFYILHVSDFHISEHSKEDAAEALKVLTSKLKEMDINVSYMIHTGDIINSNDIREIIEHEEGQDVTEEVYDTRLEEIVTNRLDIAKKIINEFTKGLDILQKNIVICCGNHDKVRYRKKKEQAFELFQKFLSEVSNHRELTALHKLDDLNVLVLNTNISDDKKVTCVDCENLKKVLYPDSQIEETNWFYTYNKNIKPSLEENKVNIIVAHQPLYDICEHIRLPYGSETQTTDFLSALQDFIKGNGVYLCGDKHTSSIAASYIHDIAHYFCGHPFVYVKNYLPEGCSNNQILQPESIKIDYNLIEVREGKIGRVRKLHLIKEENKEWKCQIQPIDAVVSNLYEKSKKYIVRNSFALLATQSSKKYASWINLSWRNLFNRLDTGISQEDLREISEFYRLFCRLKNTSGDTVEWEKSNIFYELSMIIEECMDSDDSINTQNILNIRGDYSSGKSTFLGLIYIYLLYRYSYGKINFIPAYFNLENEDVLNRIQSGSTYSVAVKNTFASFVEEIELIAKIEQTTVCYIIDGLDEQDIWSESSQDSIGRVVLDILAETSNGKYIMSFCQNKLARFKNTMPSIKYYEKSYVMYFNSISVKERETKKSSFHKFVEYIVDSNKKTRDRQMESGIDLINSEDEVCESVECSAIRKLRRLSINTGFIYHNYQYLKECKKEDTINSVYMRYIDQQHQICLNTLGYNFVHYAPAMAYLFTYEGYTYERFKSIAPGTTIYWEQKILEYSNKIYRTFIFIKKHKDAREYLLALHYNRELRFYAENPKNEIPENSIINKLISRNISIIIKKLWRNDQNKFIIVCRNLIEKRRMANSKPINNCTLSMLIYILAYLDKIPDYIRDEIKGLLLNLDSPRNEVQSVGMDTWNISGNNSEKMKKFIDLNFLHSQKILNAINTNNSTALVIELLESSCFALYNRQYMMWYYGDLTIYGENKINNLVPGKDIVNQGIDYYNCFYTLYNKIHDYYVNECTYSYPLLEFDLFTICDLVFSRHWSKEAVDDDMRFRTKDQKEKEIFIRTKNILEKYVSSHTGVEKDGEVALEVKTIDKTSSIFNIIFERCKKSSDKSNERTVYYFFKVLKTFFAKVE